jgi:hypothetical protein
LRQLALILATYSGSNKVSGMFPPPGVFTGEIFFRFAQWDFNAMRRGRDKQASAAERDRFGHTHGFMPLFVLFGYVTYIS